MAETRVDVLDDDIEDVFQTLTDYRASVGHPPDEPHEMPGFLFGGGVGSEFDPFITSVTIHADPLTIEEMRLQQHQSSNIDLSIAGANFAARGQHHSTSRSNFSGRGGSQFGHQFYHPICQVSNRQGHIALDSYNRFIEAYSRDQISPPQAYLFAPTASGDMNWHPDSGSTHHLTSDLANLNIKADDYTDTDQIQVGKGLPHGEAPAPRPE